MLGSGGTIPIPKPLCFCKICEEARNKGYPYKRCGPAIFIEDINLLIDTPPQIFESLNHSKIKEIDYLMYTHLDPDHFDGNSALVSMYLDGTKYCYKASKTIELLVPQKIDEQLKKITNQYGSLFDFYVSHNIVTKKVFSEIEIKKIKIIPIFVKDNPANAYIYLIVDKNGKRVLYAPCDIKPFPYHSKEVFDVDLLIIQPGFFESGLKNNFVYPKDNPTRKELYSYEQTLEIAKKIRAKKILFTHLEEYWNRGFEDYKKLEKDNVEFAFDNMLINL